MTDKTEITGTPAQRFGLVMSWLSAPIIFLSTLLASVALVAFIYDGPDDDYLFLSWVALFGGMISLAPEEHDEYDFHTVSAAGETVLKCELAKYDDFYDDERDWPIYV